MQNIDDYHHLIWPGIPQKHLMSKMASLMRGKRKRSSSYDENQDAWLRETTLSTSHWVSFITFAMNYKYRNTLDRSHACTAFVNLINLVATTLGGFELDIIPFGSIDGQIQTMKVDPTAHVCATTFWTQDFYARYVRGAWAKDWANSNKPWLSTKHGVGNVHLCQLICFALDPQQNSFLKGSLLPEVLNIMSQIAKLIDDSVHLLTREVTSLSLGNLHKNRKRVTLTIKTVWVETVANMVWKNEEPWIQKYSQIFFVCCKL